MDLLKLITKNPKIIDQVSKQFNLSGKQSLSALAALSGAVAGGIKKNTQKPQGVQALMSALGKGSHQRYVEEPETLANEESVREGNGILSHIFGSKEVSREVAQQASAQSGVDVGVLKKMLPLVAGMAMGGLKKETGSSGMLSGLAGGGSAPSAQSLGGLSKLLDSDGDGKITDDLMGMAGKLFGR